MTPYDSYLTWLIKPGELTLKGDNRDEFELRLRKNIQARLKGNSCTLSIRRGRFYLTGPERVRALIEEVLDHTMGISAWALARSAAKNLAQITREALTLAQEGFADGARSFKIEARRADKSVPWSSRDLILEAARAIGEALPALTVDVHTPDMTISMEVREKVWLYGKEKRGPRGLPVGTSGRGLLLLSGGIDSPVAGYLMASRGMRIDAVYFHAWPYTSDEARGKVVELARRLAAWDPDLRLLVIPFTEVQECIKKTVSEAWTTLVMRMAMMELASRLAFRYKARAVITGESLGQVASQTVENMGATESCARLPVLRPLVGLDKEDIIRIAKRIDTYETSILPYEDCCVLFSPKHPIIHANYHEARTLWEGLELKEAMDRAFAGRERLHFGRHTAEGPQDDDDE